MMTEIEKQLAQIEEQKAALLEQAKRLEEEAEYPRKLAELQSKITHIRTREEINNQIVREVFERLRADKEVGHVFSLEERELQTSIPGYYNTPLHEEDQVHSITYTQLSISCLSSRITVSDIEGDKIQLPYSINGSYRYLKIETALKKIKEYLARQARQKASAEKQKSFAVNLSEEFQSKYPTAKITFEEKWVSNPYDRHRGGKTINVMRVVFENGSWVMLQLFEQLYAIHDRYDARFKDKTMEEIIDLLAS
jgi:hypothetical protein